MVLGKVASIVLPALVMGTKCGKNTGLMIGRQPSWDMANSTWHVKDQVCLAEEYRYARRLVRNEINSFLWCSEMLDSVSFIRTPKDRSITQDRCVKCSCNACDYDAIIWEGNKRCQWIVLLEFTRIEVGLYDAVIWMNM